MVTFSSLTHTHPITIIIIIFIVIIDHHDLVPSECPGAKLHDASLLVEWEVGHVYRTGRLQIIVVIISAIVIIMKMIVTIMKIVVIIMNMIVIFMKIIVAIMKMIVIIMNMRILVKLEVCHVYRTTRLRQTLIFSRSSQLYYHHNHLIKWS